MSHYTKEKNIISFDLDGVNGVYKFDLSTGIFYGLKGNPVQTVAKKAAITNLLYPWGNNKQVSQLTYTLYYIFDYTNRTSYFPTKIKAISAAEKLDNMKLKNHSLGENHLEYIADNFKEFVEYLKTRDDTAKENGDYNLSEFYEYARVAKAKKRWSEAVIKLFPDNILNNFLQNAAVLEYSAEEMTVCAYYLVRGKMYDYERGDTRNLIEYISMCRGMEKTPQKENNFMREYCETKKEYELRKIEFDNKRIAENYAKHSKAFEFEYGDFTVVLPTTAQDLIDEGRNMHHCVGGYVNNIIEGTDYIVFIRRKDNPEQCYLTCEVLTDGRIRQYYLAYDRNIRSAEDIEFKTAFQNHLLENWGE